MYKWLGASSIILLMVALLLSAYILLGHHSKKETYFVSFSVLALMVTVTAFCLVIFFEFGR